MSPPGAKAKTTGFFRPCASWACANPAGRLCFTVMLVVAETLNGEDDSVPVTVAVSETTVPAAAVICPVIETVQACPAARLAAVQVTWRAEAPGVEIPPL